MAVPKPQIRWRGAHPNNFTVGRQGTSRDGRNSFHHIVGWRESAVIVFNQPNRGASSHFVVGRDVIDQCVSIKDTAWTDGNWESNLRSITVEHEGGWDGNGPYSAEMYENAAKLCAWLRENYGVKRAIRHRDVSNTPTACPGGLDVERIWNRATAIIQTHNLPVTKPEWMKNRKKISAKTVYSYKEKLFIYDLDNGVLPADSRRFPVNQSFLVTGETKVKGREFWITKSSMETNTGNGILKAEVKDKMWKPPSDKPDPLPDTPDWADAVVDTENKEMYVLRATPLIDLENGRPYRDKNGKEVWYEAGDIVKDVSALTVVNEVTYLLTEYSYKEIKGKRYANANGIKGSDLTTEAEATPPGTPANPKLPEDPEEPVEPMPDLPPEDKPKNNLARAIVVLIAGAVAYILSLLLG